MKISIRSSIRASAESIYGWPGHGVAWLQLVLGQSAIELQSTGPCRPDPRLARWRTTLARRDARRFWREPGDRADDIEEFTRISGRCGPQARCPTSARSSPAAASAWRSRPTFPVFWQGDPDFGPGYGSAAMTCHPAGPGKIGAVGDCFGDDFRGHTLPGTVQPECSLDTSFGTGAGHGRSG